MRTGKGRVKNRWQIALYVPAQLQDKIRREAQKRNRGYGPTVLEIVREHFQKKDVPPIQTAE